MSVSPPPVQGDAVPRAQEIATRVLALALLILGLYTLKTFIDALAWAGIFAIALWPLYNKVRAQCGRSMHAVLLPLLFTLGVALIFIAPLGIVGFQLAEEFQPMAAWLHHAQQSGIAEPEFLHRLPWGQSQIDDWWRQNLADPGRATELVQRVTRGHVADTSRLVVAQVTRRLTLFVFTLLILFFLFRDGYALIGQLRHAVTRTFGPGGERVGRQIIASVHGTVDGLVLVGLGEGVLLGIVYAIAGVPEPTVFGAFTAIAAMIPFAAPVVFLIAASLLGAKGAVVWGIVVFCTGMAVTFTADHFVRPVLIGNSTKLPFIWVFLGILGGVEAWGLLGLFLGPAIMASLSLLWREWTEKRKTRRE